MNTDNLQPLTYDENNWIDTYIEITGGNEYYIAFIIRKVTHWDYKTNMPVKLDPEPYMEGLVSWTGTLRVLTPKDFVSISSRREINQLNQVLTAIYNLASETIEDFEDY